MRITYYREISLVFLIALKSVYATGQEPGDNKAYTWFDNIIGLENTGLFNGVEYLEKHLTINEKQKYLFSNQYLSGTITYDGQPYYTIDMKYNVYDDLLLVKLKSRDGETAFQLHKDLIAGFVLEGHGFINIRNKEAEQAGIYGFYEILADEPDIQLLKKHTKKQKKKLDKQTTYYEFENDDPVFVVAVNSQYFSIRNHRSLIRIFPEHKEEIRKYFRTQKGLRRSGPESFLINLIPVLQTFVSNDF